MEKYHSDKVYRIFRTVLAPIFKFLFRPIIINGDKIAKEGSMIFAGNHNHGLDPIMVCISTRKTVHSLAKRQLFEGKKGVFFRGVGCIPVDTRTSCRDQADQKKMNRQAQSTAIEMLKKGVFINIAPEGTRNKTDQLLLPFKYGAVSMAKKTNTPILPYVIVGEFKIFRHTTIIFGEPFYVENMEMQEANEKLYKTIQNMLLKNLSEDILKKKVIDAKQINRCDEVVL